MNEQEFEALRCALQGVRKAIQDAPKLADAARGAERPRNLFEVSEGATRFSLIDPVLRALGWRLENPMEVVAECPPSYTPSTPKYKREHRRIDYALFLDSPVAFLEAKPLRHFNNRTKRLPKHVKDQLTGYWEGAGAKPRCLIATDGDVWFFRSDTTNTTVQAISIERDNEDHCMNRLSAWLARAEPAEKAVPLG